MDYYARECGAQVAVSFVDAVRSTFGLIAKHPASGSLRYAYELGLPDLHSMTLKAFLYIVFYLEQGDYVDVWRILHAKRATLRVAARSRSACVAWHAALGAGPASVIRTKV
ncbi:type II toxin-antitoxin system RelE/ParE family toxin [Rhizobium phaseoli]|uniref:type II toxin-antitoxin system RelE/ParE family toxin n=1 Tax=Rhizobium phaseoli TaxID=396 RepID=UPI001F47BE81|nr:type II toxin-antitoxin system RelE/ParE family toxin [Rhizobium phaseoli]